MKWIDFGFELREFEKANGTEVYQDDFKLVNSLERWSVVAFVR
jgi:hypothetical protein